MEQLNINDIKVIPCNGETENSAIRFETKDGKPVYWDGEGFAIDGGYTDGDDIEYFGLKLGEICGEDEETWEAEANAFIDDMGVELGAYHDDGEYYELETL